MSASASQKQRLIEIEELKKIMSTESGRRVLYRIMQHSGAQGLSYAGSTNDTMFNEGRRNEGLFLIAEMQSASTHLYYEMMKENTNASN